jgi:hypothetical protein
MTRAANFVSTGLQQGKDASQLIDAAQKKFSEQANAHVKYALADAETPELVRLKVGDLQKASGTLMKAADQAPTLESVADTAQAKGLGDNVPLKDAMLRASQRSELSGHASGQPTAAGPVEHLSAETRKPTALEANQEFVLQATKAQIAQSSQQDSIEKNTLASAASSEQPKPALITEKATSATTSPAVLAGEKKAEVLPVRPTEPVKHNEGEKKTLAEVKPEPLLKSQEAGETTRGASAHPEKLTKVEIAGELESFGSSASGRQPKTVAFDQGSAGKAAEISQAVSPDGPAARKGLSFKPTLSAEAARPEISAKAESGSPPVPQRPAEAANSAPQAVTAASPAPAPVSQQSSNRVTLAQAMTEHLQAKGFDREVTSLAPEIAKAVSDNAATRPANQTLVVLHKQGENVATATSENGLNSVLRQGDSVLNARTLEHIQEKGLDVQAIERLRAAAPEAMAGKSSLEVADSLGPEFLDKNRQQNATPSQGHSAEGQQDLHEQNAARISRDLAAGHSNAEPPSSSPLNDQGMRQDKGGSDLPDIQGRGLKLELGDREPEFEFSKTYKPR